MNISGFTHFTVSSLKLSIAEITASSLYSYFVCVDVKPATGDVSPPKPVESENASLVPSVLADTPVISSKFEDDDDFGFSGDDYYDDDDDGTYEETVASSDYQVLPINGIVGGITGNPFYIIELISDGNHEWPLDFSSNRPRAEITAKWGYATTPEQIRQATLMLASELFAMRNAPLGVAGVGDFGVVNIQQNREITRLIAPFRKGTVLGVV